ncbi:DUF2515 family protein [Alicyclobacillus mengziensis]|uniref:DUF2515 family protein n=1 Tax=Alicyclobacillus mengziensis TaxID=2931921 RepID=A0A9X7W2A8_9BACL|nr:DUF2515 family protein [Alicyclobacillus mengziensis]QSO48945.1 DUF2515 family protein [Alicyclobacillus mengziensis]
MKGWNRARLTWMMTLSSYRKRVTEVVLRLKTEATSKTAVDGETYGKTLELSDDVQRSIDAIRRQTRQANRNNITRTNAYIDFFERHPEIHWALLAHCVSRNGGWCMSDTKGEWFSRMASNEQSQAFFSFLERSNWLIFEDAYPQLLLYEESRRRTKNLSFLLSLFGVSRFMKVMWDLFWETGDSNLLTRALIINEQNHIESRVVKDSVYESTVESSLQFRVESLLNLNQVLLPYHMDRKTHVAGTTMRHFHAIHDRIETGLRLYRILYQNERVHEAIVDFMVGIRHRGSRADYWPERFTTARPDVVDEVYRPRFSDDGTEDKIYSPALADVWPDVPHQPAESGDWFQDLSSVIYLFSFVPNGPIDISHEYIDKLKTIEKTIMLKEKTAKTLTPR